MSAPEFIAPPDTVLGLLQRGRGEGYRRVLDLPRAEAHELLVECITVDPRIDPYCESRKEYYASIAIEIELPLEPWATSLAADTLTELAKRNYGNAKEMISLPDDDEPVLQIPRAEEPLPDLTWLTLGQILDLANPGNFQRLGKIVAEKVDLSDVDMLVSRVSLRTPFSAHVALAGLAKIAPASLAGWLTKLFLTFPYSSPLNVSTFAQVLSRRAVFRTILSLPAPAILPIARDWITHADPSKRELAEEILEMHATAEDLPILRKSLLPMLASPEAEFRCFLVQAFYNLPNIGIIPELSHLYYHFRYSMGRSYAAKAIQITSPEFFAKTLALECLWDCENETRELGAQFVPLGSSEALNRIRHLAEDSFEDEKVRMAAKARLESITLVQPAG